MSKLSRCCLAALEPVDCPECDASGTDSLGDMCDNCDEVTSHVSYDWATPVWHCTICCICDSCMETLEAQDRAKKEEAD